MALHLQNLWNENTFLKLFLTEHGGIHLWLQLPGRPRLENCIFASPPGQLNKTLSQDKIKKNCRECSSVVEYVSSMQEALGSIPNTTSPPPKKKDIYGSQSFWQEEVTYCYHYYYWFFLISTKQDTRLWDLTRATSQFVFEPSVEKVLEAEVSEVLERDFVKIWWPSQWDELLYFSSVKVGPSSSASIVVFGSI